MKQLLSFSAIKGILLGSGTVAAVCAGAIAVNVHNSFKANDESKINLVESGAIETKAPNVLEEAENEVNESKAVLEEANKEVEKATEEAANAQKEVADAEEAITKAKEAKKLAEAEVRNATTKEAKAAAEAKVKAAEDAVTKAEATKKDATVKAQNAEKAITEAQNNKNAAEQRVQKAEENKKAIEEEIRKTQETEENTSEPKQQTTTEVAKKETTTKAVNSQNNKTTASQNNTSTSTTTTTTTKENNQNIVNQNNNNTTVTNPNTNESRSLTDEQLKKMLDAAAKGEELDRQKYEEEYEKVHGHAPEEEKHEVEFHFYSNLNPLKVRLYDHVNYYTTSRCGATGSGCIWFAEFACDLNECVGFPDDVTGELKDDVIYSRRADIKEYTMQAPEARYGYKFKQWELISERKNTIYGQTGLAYKYVAVYEKVQ